MAQRRSESSQLPAFVQRILAGMRRALRSFESERTNDHATWRLTVVTQRDEIDDLWIAECRELPGCMSQGATEEEALQNLTDAIAGVLTVRMQASLQQQQSTRRTVSDSRTGRMVAICV